MAYLYQSEQLKWHLTAFRNNWRNAITSLPTEKAAEQGKNAEFINSGSSHAYGLESEFYYFFPNVNLVAHLSGSYTRSKNEETQQEYGMFPRYKLNAGVRYEKGSWRFSLEQLSKFKRKLMPKSCRISIESTLICSISLIAPCSPSMWKTY